jgi:hypothetical protein
MARSHRLLFASLSLLVACTDDGAATAGTGGAGAGGSATTGTSTSSVTTTASTSATSGSGGQGGGFVLSVHTEVDPAAGLVLRTNLPAMMSDCAAAVGAPCADLDQDGLTDGWEDVVLDRLRPIQRLDEDEALVSDATAVLADVGRVALVGQEVHVFIMLGYSKDYGSCGFTAHDGDSERVALALSLLGDAGDARVEQAYTAAHEGTATDHSRLFATADLPDLVYENDPALAEPRWVVFPSQDKHGTYATIDICENISVVPCFDEDCAPDGVADPSLFDRLPTYVNAGEEAHPMVTDLGPIGFPGDDAWAVQDFCGGLGGSPCSDDVRNKLLNDPF